MELGTGEIVLVFVVAMVFLGSRWLPELGHGLRRAVAVSRRDGDGYGAGVRVRLPDLSWLLVPALVLSIAAFVEVVALPMARAGEAPGLVLVVLGTLVAAAAIAAQDGASLDEGIAAWRARRRAARFPVWTEGRALVPDSVARLRGRVEALEAGPVAPAAQAVLAREVLRSAGRSLDERTVGSDFVLRLADGTRVGVAAAAAAPARRIRILAKATGPGEQRGNGWTVSARVAPGDEIEVVGWLGRTIDPQAPASAPRALPLGWKVDAPPGEPLLVSTVRPDRR